MTRGLAQGGCHPQLWKRDIESAFRKLPIQENQLDLSYVVFLVNCVPYVAHHLAMPVGTTNAVHAWHRVGTMLSTSLRRFFLVQSAKFVDDFFGVSAEGVSLSGGHCLDALGSLLGFPT